MLQKKALRLIHFRECNAHTALLFFKSKIVKVLNKIKIENCLFIVTSTFYNYEILFAARDYLKIPTVTTATYGKGAFNSMATKT